MSKLRFAAAAFAFFLAAGGAVASPQSDGTSLSANGAVAHQLFDKGDGYFWVLVRDPRNDGYQCSVSFVTTSGTYSIHGPMDMEGAKAGSGSLWFDSPKIPRATSPMQRVALAVRRNDGAFNWPALQTTVGKASHGTLIVAVQIASVLKEKADTNDLSVSLAGNEVFRAKLAGLQKAYARLGDCMTARPAN